MHGLETGRIKAEHLNDFSRSIMHAYEIYAKLMSMKMSRDRVDDSDTYCLCSRWGQNDFAGVACTDLTWIFSLAPCNFILFLSWQYFSSWCFHRTGRQDVILDHACYQTGAQRALLAASKFAESKMRQAGTAPTKHAEKESTGQHQSSDSNKVSS